MTYPIAVAGVAQLALSTALLLWASLAHGLMPPWAGPLDGMVAFTLVITTLWLRARTEDAR
jgi:hypothetical protein